MTDRPYITLAEAAEFYGISKAVLKEAGKYRGLRIYNPDRVYRTTHKDMQEWIESCRVVPKDRAYISTANEANGKYATERITFARAALRQTLNAPKNS